MPGTCMLFEPLLLRGFFLFEKTPAGSVILNGKLLLVMQGVIRGTGT